MHAAVCSPVTEARGRARTRAPRTDGCNPPRGVLLAAGGAGFEREVSLRPCLDIGAAPDPADLEDVSDATDAPPRAPEARLTEELGATVVEEVPRQ